MRTPLRYLWLLFFLLIGMVGSAFAQSACTAVWGIATDNANFNLRYLNTSTNLWSNPLLTFGGVPGTGAGQVRYNALSGSSANGRLYVVERNTLTLYSIDLNTNPPTTATVGIIPAPTPPAGAGNIIGATTDSAGALFLYASETPTTTFATPSFIVTAQISLATAATLTSWTQLLTTSGGSANLAGSGDSFIDQSGNNWIISNTRPPTLHRLDLNIGASFGRTNSPALSLTGAPDTPYPFQAAGVSTDPLTGNTYMSGFTTQTVSGFSSVAFAVNLTTGVSTILPPATNTFYFADMGNCTVKPAPPTITKSFNPASRPAPAPGTSTLTINISNSNSVPTYLYRTLTDALPAGLLVNNNAGLIALQGSCVAAGNVITAAVNANNVTFAEGGRIPAGGCTYSFVVRAAAVGAFVNTIPAGSLSTSAGVNAAQAQATFLVGQRDFSITKSQRVGTTGTLTSGPLSVPSGSTMQYVLEIVNNAGSTANGTVTFTDLLPSQITPVLSVTAVEAGAGTCATNSLVVTARTQVNGTFTAAPVGGTCTVTITARASVTAVLLSFPNTVTMGPVVPTTDSATGNNNATVTTNITPGSNITISKTNNTTTLNTFSTTSYTVTVANLTGGAAANGALVADPVKAGLSCTSVVCTTSGGAVCPVAPLSLTTFQTTGIPVTTFPAGSTANFVVSCLVTATGF